MPRLPNEIPMMPEGADPTVPWREPEPVVPKPVEEPPQRQGPSPRQTLSYLRGLMENHGLEPKAKLGQNFLIDLNMLDVVIRAAELGPDDCVLEVGTGTGSLSARMAEFAGGVYTVEVDKDFFRLAQHVLATKDNVVSLQADALERKHELNPEMLAGWDALAKKRRLKKRKLVANLPYSVATPIISNLLQLPMEIERMVVMVQWEIGERLRALPSTKDYNALSVLVQAVADVETVRKVAPSNFFPKPQVDSAIMLIKPNPEKRAKVGDIVRFRTFLRDLYVHRRKNIRAALAGWPSGDKKDKKVIDARLNEIGIDGNVRAETLDIEQHLRLCATFG